jgi:hypothetical protein
MGSSRVSRRSSSPKRSCRTAWSRSRLRLSHPSYCARSVPAIERGWAGSQIGRTDIPGRPARESIFSQRNLAYAPERLYYTQARWSSQGVRHQLRACWRMEIWNSRGMRGGESATKKRWRERRRPLSPRSVLLQSEELVFDSQPVVVGCEKCCRKVARLMQHHAVSVLAGSP